jgi:hypothetical protein
MKRIRYNRFHLILDIVGLFGVGLTIYFYYQGHIFRQSNEELYTLWANFATDIVSIWIGVRIIEYIIRKHEKESGARIRSVRNMRFLMRNIRNGIEYPRRADWDQLKYEFNWTKRMFNKHHKIFRQNEISDVNTFYSGVEVALSELYNLLQMKVGYDASAETREKFERKKEELWSYMEKLEEARLKAEENILAETDEEWV